MIHAMLPLARGSDPITSFQAADSAKAFIRTHEIKIVYALRQHGPSGVDKIAALTDLEPHAVGKRMKALFDNSLVKFTGRVVKSNSGRNQREWAAA